MVESAEIDAATDNDGFADPGILDAAESDSGYDANAGGDLDVVSNAEHDDSSAQEPQAPITKTVISEIPDHLTNAALLLVCKSLIKPMHEIR